MSERQMEVTRLDKRPTSGCGDLERDRYRRAAAGDGVSRGACGFGGKVAAGASAAPEMDAVTVLCKREVISRATGLRMVRCCGTGGNRSNMRMNRN